MSNKQTSIAQDFDNAMDNAIRQYELKTALALAEAVKEKAAREAADAAREAAETRTRELEAQLAELLKKQR